MLRKIFSINFFMAFFIHFVICVPVFSDEDRAIKSGCESVVQLRNLTVPQSNTIPQTFLVVWGSDQFYPIHCMSDFVVFYEGEKRDANILCASYNVKKVSESEFGCLANFSDADCNQTIKISLEAWTLKGNLMQANTRPVTIDCEMEGDDFSPIAPLADDLEATTEVFENEEHTAVNFAENLTENLSSVDAEPSEICTTSEWSTWTSCSITCGTAGVMKRTRFQRGSKKCQKKEEETKQCLVNLCPIDCQWAAWAEWSSCSQTCGTGTKIRKREIAIPKAFGGRDCRADEREEMEKCLVNECPVDGVWSSWSHWSYCSVTCGEGTRKRRRSCSNPAPEFGGSQCEGMDSQMGNCTQKDCPVIDGGWSPWSRWSPCSEECGEGKITRTRSCSNPFPSPNGKPCYGSNLQTRVCSLDRCSGHDANKRKIPDISPNFRPTVRTKTTTSTSVSPSPSPSTDFNICRDAPDVVGFLGPVGRNGLLAYECSAGKVLDLLTNRRTIQLPCHNATSLISPNVWPKCKFPKYCVGPP